jgi:hypothetical protein
MMERNQLLIVLVFILCVIVAVIYYLDRELIAFLIDNVIIVALLMIINEKN